MKKLVTGKITYKELADWFGLAATSLKNKATKKKRLEELKHFADYHMEGNKVVIDEVYIEEYSKQGSKAFQMVRDELDKAWSEDGLDSCSHVGLKIGQTLKNELTITDNTVYTYTRKSRNELYGVPFQQGGKLGSCIYLWCKKYGDGINARYERLSEEEEQIKQDLIHKYFGNADEKQIIVKGMVGSGEISKKDAWDVLEELTNMRDGNFMSFLGELQEKVGCQIIRGTLVTRDNTVEMIEFNDEPK